MEKLVVCICNFFIYYGRFQVQNTQQDIRTLPIIVLLKKVVKASFLSPNNLSLGIWPSSYLWAQDLKISSYVDFESFRQTLDMS